MTVFDIMQNDLIHGWGLDMKLGYCAQVIVLMITILWPSCEHYLDWWFYFVWSSYSFWQFGKLCLCQFLACSSFWKLPSNRTYVFSIPFDLSEIDCV